MNTKPQPYIPAANWRQIRRKLQSIGYHAREVRTVWGKGYVLSASDAL